jgi:hypothetical protein
VSRTRAAVLLAAAAYAGLLATTRPFTDSADAVTALGLAAGAGALLLRLAPRRAVVDGPAASEPAGSAVPWLVLLALAVAWELYCFFGGPRPAHPTFSTIYDLAARWEAAKAAAVLAWLFLGWELVR